MNKSIQIQKLGYAGNIDEVAKDAALFYSLGNIQTTKYLNEGYEDYNIKITTQNGQYILKLFANNQLGDYSKTRRGPDVVERLLEILKAAENIGLNSPRLRKNKNKEMIFRDKNNLVGIVYDWIEGKTFYDLETIPTRSELEIIIQQATKINQITLQPVYYHDVWAVTNIHSLYQKVKSYLSETDRSLIISALERFDRIPFNQLPKCLVHGDFTKGNVIITPSGKPFIVDFSVSNYTTRIVELGLIVSNLLYDVKKKTSLEERVSLVAELYQKYNQLTQLELKFLYNLSLSSAAMELLGSYWRQKFFKDTSEETKYWLSLGRDNLKEGTSYSQ